MPIASWDDDGDDVRVHPEQRLAELASAVGPLRRVLAAIVAQLIESDAPARLCYARLGDYARERAGVSGRQLQELARVHRELVGLPALEQALLANRLSWSKVRLVARVATAEDEVAWIARAQAVSTRRLEREVREHARDPARSDPDEDEEPLTRVTVRCTPAVCERWSLAREMAERVAGQRLRDGDALEHVVAEVLSELPVDPAFSGLLDEPPPARLESRDSPEWRPAPPARALACEPPGQVAALAVGLEEADAFELDRRLRAAVRLEQTLDAAMAPWLRRVVCAEYEWSGEDYQPLASYAPEQLGMSASKARALIRLDRAAEVCPELREAYRSGNLSWVKAQCLLPLLLLDLPGEWRPAWVAWAGRVTVRRLERDVQRALLLRAGHGPAFDRCQFQPERAQDAIPEAERQMCAHDVDPEASQELAFRVPHPVAALFRAAQATLRKRLQAGRDRPVHDGEVFDALMSTAVLAWIRRNPRAPRPDPVIERDGYQCAIPGCMSRRSLHDHHVIFRSRGGNDEEENRLTLCAFHHQRCVHAQLMRVTGDAPDSLLFEIGLRTSGPPLVCYRSGDVEIRPPGSLRVPSRRRAAAA